MRKLWKHNTEDEALLGVSLTGIMDNKLTNLPTNSLKDLLNEFKQAVIDTNKEWSGVLGIKQATATTCVKPSGTVSQLVDSASGIHARFSPYYIRRVRADKKDPLAQMMKDQGVPCEDDVMNPNVYVFSFPIKSPDGAVCVKDVSAKDQLDLWLMYYEDWCEHKPSVTIYYKDEEFLMLGQQVYNNFDKISGISFLPYSDHVYKQAPYEEINEDEYENLTSKMPTIDWESLINYEKEDSTESMQTLACVGGVCEI